MGMHCIVVPVKIDGGLLLSVLRKKQLFTKTGVKSLHFQKVPIFKNISNPAIWNIDRESPWKKSHFFCI
jgi:hypothetical protein